MMKLLHEPTDLLYFKSSSLCRFWPHSHFFDPMFSKVVFTKTLFNIIQNISPKMFVSFYPILPAAESFIIFIIISVRIIGKFYSDK